LIEESGVAKPAAGLNIADGAQKCKPGWPPVRAIQFFILGDVFEGATAALSSAELPEKRPYRTIQQAADDAPSFTQIE